MPLGKFKDLYSLGSRFKMAVERTLIKYFLHVWILIFTRASFEYLMLCEMGSLLLRMQNRRAFSQKFQLLFISILYLIIVDEYNILTARLWKCDCKNAFFYSFWPKLKSYYAKWVWGLHFMKLNFLTYEVKKLSLCSKFTWKKEVLWFFSKGLRFGILLTVDY